MKLYYSRNLNPRVAVAVAKHLNSKVEYIAASPRAPDQEDAFRDINPNTLVPVLVENNRSIWETDAIACRLSAIAGSNFWRKGDDEFEMIRWISWSTHHLTKSADVLYWWNVVLPTFSNERPKPGIIEEALKEFRKFAGILDKYLEQRKWLVGNEVSYADFRTATSLPFAVAAGLPLSEFQQVNRWHNQLLAIDAWRNPFEGLE